MAAPTVTVAPAQPGAPVDNFVLPGNVTAYTDSPIYARTDGYLAHWYYDIGARVKQGRAAGGDFDTPELDQQLAQAEADLATARGQRGQSRKVQAERYNGLVELRCGFEAGYGHVCDQAASTAAAVQSAQANVQRLKELQSFEKDLCAVRRRGDGAQY